VPSRPTLFVQTGDHDWPEGPTFWRPDGNPIRIVGAQAIKTYPQASWMQLDVEAGEILVRLQGSDDVVARFTIDPKFTPKTRRVDLLRSTMRLSVDSDAIMFRVQGRYGSDDFIRNSGSIWLVEGRRQRVDAYYPNGKHEVIFEGIPTTVAQPSTPTRGERIALIPILIAWSLLGIVAFWRHRTNRRPWDTGD